MTASTLVKFIEEAAITIGSDSSPSSWEPVMAAAEALRGRRKTPPHDDVTAADDDDDSGGEYMIRTREQQQSEGLVSQQCADSGGNLVRALCLLLGTDSERGLDLADDMVGVKL